MRAFLLDRNKSAVPQLDPGSFRTLAQETWRYEPGRHEWRAHQQTSAPDHKLPAATQWVVVTGAPSVPSIDCLL